MVKRYGICGLLGLYLLLGNIYGVVTPVMEASDEIWHYPMVKYVADHWSLPFQEPGIGTPWRQEGSQAPFYYLLSAVLTFWIDTSDLEQIRWLNPHADNGIIREDGNTNLIVHSQAESFPWRGTTLAIHLIRFVSVWMGAGTVFFTYLLVRQVWPDRVGMALAAAAITAFNPMFCFITGSVNNDNLAMLLCAAAIWLLVRLVQRHGRQEPLPWRVWWIDTIVLGVVLGLGVLTKSQSMGLLPLAALAIAYVAWKRRSWQHFYSGGLVTAGLVALLSGWWFVRNALLYDGDWMGIERFILILGYRDPPATLRQLWGERRGFMMAYWGLFGGVNVPLPQWVYRALNGTLLVSGVGLLIGLGRYVWGLRFRLTRRLGPLNLKPFCVQLALLFLWPAAAFVLWALWAVRTWSSQGRLVFSAISAWSVWMALGLCQLIPRRWAGLVPGALGAFMLVLSAWAPFGTIAPAYQPSVLPATVEPAPEHVLRADVGGQLRLLGYEVEDVSVQPGGAFRFTLYWEAERVMDRDWSIFCHVLDSELESPVAVRDRYPGQGLLATSRMEPGLRWVDQYVVLIPETAYAPSDAILEVGLYNGDERPPISIELGEGHVVGNALRFQPLRIEPQPGDLPNPVRVNFEDRVALIGWDVDRRVVAPGDPLRLTLYWEGLASMDRSYTVSTQMVTGDMRKAAHLDSWPGDRDTKDWEKGWRIVDRREMTVFADARAEVYDILVGVYGWETSEQVRRLRIIDAEGRVLPSDTLTLGKVRVVH